MIKNIDIYILKHILFKIAYCIICFIVIFIVVDLIDHIDKFIDSSMSKNSILQYYIYTIPWYISIALPMSILIATVFTIGSMQKLNEITALKSNGISFFRLSIPFLCLGVFFSIFCFKFDNSIVTKSFQKRVLLEEKSQMWGPSNINVRKREIFRQLASNEILYIKRFQYSTNTATNVTIQKFDENNLSKRIDIDKLVWDETDSTWHTENLTVKQWDNSRLTSNTIYNDTTLSLGIFPQDLIVDSTRPREMSYNDLQEFVKKMERSAIFSPIWKVDLYFKTAFAATSLLMVIFGLALSMNNSKNNLATGLGLSIGIIFMYYISLKMGQSIGYKEVISPFLSVWIPNFIFFTIGIYLYSKIKT